MTDRLTDEQLREIIDSLMGCRAEISTYNLESIATELLALRSRVAQIEAALRGLIKCLENDFDGAKLATAIAFAALARPAEGGVK